MCIGFCFVPDEDGGQKSRNEAREGCGGCKENGKGTSAIICRASCMLILE